MKKMKFLKGIGKDNQMTKFIISLALVIILAMSSVTSISAKETQDYLDEIEILRDLIMNNYSVDDVTEKELFEAAMSGMTDLLDKYSVFYNDEESKGFFNVLKSSYVGIGVQLQVIEEKVVITDVFKGGAAFDADVQVNDIITKVNGDDASLYDLNALVDKIIGEEGSYVTIEFKRGGLIYERELERRKITVPTVVDIDLDQQQYKLTEDVLKQIAAYKVSSFSNLTDEEFGVVLEKSKEAGVKYLLLDMRGNGGGYLDTSVNMLGKLLEEGTIVSLVDKNGNTTAYRSELKEAPFKVVLVVDESSASATEIFAAAIKDSGVGVVVGEKTFGKGVAQNLYKVGTDYFVKLTTQEFYSPNGDKINGIGVTPNIVVDLPEFIFSDKRMFVTDKDEQIKNAEGILAALGYFNEVPDDTYTNATFKAVWAFQEATGLYPYGVCDFTTQARLNTEYRLAIQKNDLQINEAIKWIVEDTQK